MSLSSPDRMLLAARIGNRIRAFREALKIRQGELAKASGLRQSTLCRIEMGTSSLPDIDTLVRIAWGLKLKLVDLVEGVEEGVGCSSTGVLPKES